MNLARLRLIAFDVDGVLTDGTLLLGPGGAEWKAFHVRDGLAIARAVECGLHVAFVSSRESEAVARRAVELNVVHCLQRCRDKRAALIALQQQLVCTPDDCAYVGDDLVDLPAFEVVGLRIAVADAAVELKQQADLVTTAAGGRGVAREVLELILKAQDQWLPAPRKPS